MRSLILVSLTIAFLAVPAVAQQGGGQQQRPPAFEDEELKKWGELEQKKREAFSVSDYAKALPILKEQVTIMEKVIERLEKTEVDTEEQENAKKSWMGRYMMQTAGLFYDQSCCHSMTDKKDEAITALKKSIELGYMDLDHMKADSDLDPIRETPEYKAVLAGLEYNEVVEIYKPESAGETPVAIVVALHWAKGNETVFLEKFKDAADQAKVLLVLPRGPVTIGPKQFAWRRISDDEDSGLKKIKFAIAHAREKHALPTAPVYLMGVGEGGTFATLGALKMPKLVKGGIQINAYWNKYYMEEFLPAAKTAGTKICLIHGKEDAFYAKAETAMEQMKGEEVKSKLIPFDGGRKLPDDICDKVKVAIDWLQAK